MRKPVFGVPDLLLHKPVCTATKDGQRLVISDFILHCIYPVCSENKGDDPLHGIWAANLQLKFSHICKKQDFSCHGSFSVGSRSWYASCHEIEKTCLWGY